ncbi:hypothetical protein [Chondromyces crocatus]|uniref:Secreted protein n=1 Tax=Chondromyces crocatus TaxID=52 RepID=A0A0K1ES46_CHOCO|nr:hypothetical protein [Chondromyces crocatus]AKT43443.1 uncharacterized protein CMC5_076750 [Chondromyces crocatus]
MKALFLFLGLSAPLLVTAACGRGGEGPASHDKTGAPPCDAYVARLEACSASAPAELREAHAAAIREARDRFEQKVELAETDPERLPLEETCKQLTDSLSERAGCP